MNDQAGPEVMWGRIADYLSGACNPEERSAVEAWAEAHPGNRKIFDQVKLIWSQSPRRPLPPADIDIGALKAKVAIGIGTRSLHPSTLPDRVRKNRGGKVFSSLPLQRWVGYFAAAVFIVLAVSGIKYISSIVGDVRPTPTTKVYSTATGQRAKIILADGSNVILAPSTMLRVSDRNVELHGEAVFNVIHSGGEPFIVRAGNTVTRVLGTTFSVRSYGGKVRVAVAEGRVSANDVVLSAGDVVTVARDGTEQLQRDANIGNMFAWTSGRLVFRLTPLSEAIPELERWYGLDIQASGELLSCTVTMTLESDTPSDMIELLQSALQARAVRSGNVVKLISITP